MKRYNTFIWLEVMLKLTGDIIYQPHETWVLRSRDDIRIESDLFVYVYFIIPTRPSKEYCWKVLRSWGQSENIWALRMHHIIWRRLLND